MFDLCEDRLVTVMRVRMGRFIMMMFRCLMLVRVYMFCFCVIMGMCMYMFMYMHAFLFSVYHNMHMCAGNAALF